MKKPTLCLAMMVKNEEHAIARALKSAIPYIDRFVICDTGSTDATKQVIIDTLHEAGIPGEIVDVPWVNFGHNRSEAIRLSRLTGIDYTLMLDADLELISYCGDFRQYLKLDGYELRYEGDLDYTNTRIFSNKHDWRYEGVTHEYPLSTTAGQVSELGGVVLRDHQNGGNRGDKFERDVRLLTGAVEADPNDARSVFYLANSYRDLGKLGEALYWYERRSTMVGFDEETWYALYQKAVMMERIGIRTQSVVEAYMQAYHARPHRLEPLYKIAEKLHTEGQYAQAMVYAAIWIVGFPYPQRDRLFIDAPVYRYLMPLVAAKLCLKTSRIFQGEGILRKLLTDKIPEWVKTQASGLLHESEAKRNPPVVETVLQIAALGMDYHVTIVKPKGYVHSDCFNDTARAITESLDELGYAVRYEKNVIDTRAINIVFGVHLLTEDEAMRLPANTILFNMEQLGVSWTPAWYMKLSSKYVLWDYSPINLPKWKAFDAQGKRVELIQLGYSKAMTRIPHRVDEDIDVLFYGRLTDRRVRILDELKERGLKVEAAFGVYGADLDTLIARSKVVLNLHAYSADTFEIARVGYLLANSKAVVSETSPDTPLALLPAIVESPYDGLVQDCVLLVHNQHRRKQLEKRGLACFRSRSQTKLLEAVVGGKTLPATVHIPYTLVTP